MSTTKNVNSEAYTEYTRLLRRLHALIRLGDDESPDGEAMRDAMDDPWRRLSELELARVRGLGADLNAIDSENLAANDSLPHDLFAFLFLEAQKNQDWNKALNLLRSFPWFFSPGKLLFLKGIFWARLEDYETALLFFEEAIDRGPAERQFVLALLQALLVLGHPIKAMDRILQISDEQPDLIPDYLVETARANRVTREEMDGLERISENFRRRRIEVEAANSERVRDLYLEAIRHMQKNNLLFITDDLTSPKDLLVFAA